MIEYVELSRSKLPMSLYVPAGTPPLISSALARIEREGTFVKGLRQLFGGDLPIFDRDAGFVHGGDAFAAVTSCKS